jgi:hypothetical protein
MPNLKLIFVSFCLLCGFSGYTQEGYTYSPRELTAFVNVYMTIKSFSSNQDSLISVLLIQSDVAPERYGEIIRAEVTNRPLVLTSDEQKLLEIIRIEKEKDQVARDEEIVILCDAASIQLEKYREILSFYKTSPRFQHEIKAYFDTYLQKQ